MDVHKNSIDIAIADEGRNAEVRHFGKIGGTISALAKAVKKLAAKGKRLFFVYEAGPCGYQIYRYLIDQRHDCTVAAPSRIPKQSGRQIKNDRRDAMMLAQMHRAGELTPVYVPTEQDEALRDLFRAREQAKSDTKRTKQRLLAFLLRSGNRYKGKRAWSQTYMRWLSDLKMPHRSQQVVLQEHINTLDQCQERVDRLTDQIQQMVPEWHLYPIVQALKSLRGVSEIVASATVAELSDFQRFRTPRDMMSYLGLDPSEYSSGNRIRRGPITKTGNSCVRRMLVEASWAYRYPPRVTRPLLNRQQDLPQHIRDIAWKAQLRLCRRYKYLFSMGKSKQVIITAIARELCGFIWDIANQVELPAAT
jgi:transposase